MKENVIRKNETTPIKYFYRGGFYYLIESNQRQNIGGENCLNLSSCYICLCLNRLVEHAVNILLERSVIWYI